MSGLTEMNAAVICRYNEPFEVKRMPVPEIKENEVLVKVTASGLCSTDLHIRDGRMDLGQLPRIPGHETAGYVERIGPGVSGVKEGQRVTVAIDVNCGKCGMCLSGRPNLCRNLIRVGFERDGGHSDYVAVPAENLVPLPDSIGYEEASILPDAVACIYHSLITQGQLEAGQKVLILGAGGLGIHGVQIGVMAGAEVYATSRNSERLNMVERFGGIGINTGKSSLVDVIPEFTNGEGVDIVADCIGTVESVKTALELVRPGGKVLVIAYLAEEFQVPSFDLFIREKEIIGCRGSIKQDSCRCC